MYCQNCGSENQQGAAYCSSCGTSLGNGQATQRKSADERKALLARQIANMVPRGWRVESQSDYQAVLVSGKSVNHVLHLILTLITCFTWGIVWAALVIFGGEKREIAEVDEWGNVNLTRTGGTTSKVIAGVGVVLAVIIGFAIAVAALSGIIDSESEQANFVYTQADPGSAQSGTISSDSAPEGVQPRQVSTTSSQGASASPTDTAPTPFNAEEIQNDYETNETEANLKWKGKTLLVTLQGIDEIEDRGRILKWNNDELFDWGYIQMDFRDDHDVVGLVPGDSVTAICDFRGYKSTILGDEWLEFSDCIRSE